jgi:hypothetical protein
MLSEERIKKFVDEHKVYLDLLEESDRTGVLRKACYKERVTFTIDESIMSKFRKLCIEKRINMSAKIEEYIEKVVKEGL